MTDLMRVVSKRMRVLMAEADMSATQLADKAGVSVDAVRKYLRGEMVPTLETTYKLATALGCTPNDLCAFNAAKTTQETTA